MSNPQSQKFEGSSKISWLLKIFGSIHYVSNTSHNFACVIFELCNQQKKKKKKKLSVNNLFIGILQMLVFIELRTSLCKTFQIYKTI